MTRTHLLLACLIAALSVPAPALAQNREQQQLLAEMRMLEEQVQQLRLSVNTLESQLKDQGKAMTGQLDAQTQATTRAFANLQQQVKDMAGDVSTAREKLEDNNSRVTKLTSELDAIRKGLDMLTQLVTQALAQGQPIAPPEGATPAAPAAGVNVPPSPSAYYSSAFALYTAGQYELAIAGLQDFLSKFPNEPNAVDAQFFIGESYFNLGKYEEAIAAYDVVITKYKTSDSDNVPGAYFKQGVCYETLRQPAKAKADFELVVKMYPDSANALRAKERLKGIK